MKKLLSAILVLGILVGVSGVVIAGTEDYGYITVRCTATVSIDIYPGTTPDGYQAAPGTELLVTSPTLAGAPAVVLGSATVKNDSQGAICKWYLKFYQIYNVDRDTQEWVYGSKAGNYSFEWEPDSDLDAEPLQVSLAGLFAPSAPVVNDFAVEDLFTNTVTSWKQADTGNYEPADTADYDPNPLITITEHLTSPGDTRGLWFYLKVPTAVGDDDTRRLVIQVSAALAGS